MKAKVAITNFWLDGTKYKRGDIVEVEDIHKHGSALEVYVEPPKPKRKKKAVKKVQEPLALDEVQDAED